MEAPPAPVELAPPQDGAHAAEQLSARERLRHVVVGSELEPEHAVRLRVARRQHEDRDVALRSQSATDLDAREAGQHHVEHDERVPAGAAGLERGRPVPLLVDLEALASQRERDDVTDARVVVHEQDPLALPVRRRKVQAAGTSSLTRAGARRILKTVPWPGEESSSIRPPSVRTDSQTIARPRPKPSASRSPR